MQTDKTAAQEAAMANVGMKQMQLQTTTAETSLMETIRRHDTGLTALKSVNAEDGLTADRNVEDEETGPLSVCVFWTAGAPNPWLWTSEPLFFPESVKENKDDTQTPTEQMQEKIIKIMKSAVEFSQKHLNFITLIT